MNDFDSGLTIPPRNSRQYQLRRAVWSGSYPHTFGTTLLVAAIEEFGPDCMDWEPETFEMEIRDRYECDLDDDMLDRLMTAKSLLQVGRFYRVPADFFLLAPVLALNSFSSKVWVFPDADDLVWAWYEGAILQGTSPDDPGLYSDDVADAVVLLLQEYGYIQPPDCLRFLTSRFGSFDLGFLDDMAVGMAIFQDLQDSKKQLLDRLTLSRLDALQDQLYRVCFHEKTASKAVQAMEAVLRYLGRQSTVPTTSQLSSFFESKSEDSSS